MHIVVRLFGHGKKVHTVGRLCGHDRKVVCLCWTGGPVCKVALCQVIQSMEQCGIVCVVIVARFVHVWLYLQDCLVLVSRLCSLLKDWSQCCMVGLVTVAGLSDEDVG